MVGEKRPQHLEKLPGTQPREHSKLLVLPETADGNYRRQGKLLDKVALVTGGDSGIGRAMSLLCAKEGADVVIVYLNEHEDVEDTRQRVERIGRRCITIAGDLDHPEFCRLAVARTVEIFGRLDVLVNNAAEQHSSHSIREVAPMICSETS